MKLMGSIYMSINFKVYYVFLINFTHIFGTCNVLIKTDNSSDVFREARRSD